MGWAFFELSGGTDFVPRKAELIAAAEAAQQAEAQARLNRIAARAAPVDPPVTQPRIVQVRLRETAPVAAPVRDVDTPILEHGPADPIQDQPTLISLEQSASLFARPLTQFDDIAVSQTPILLQRNIDIREVAGSRVNMRNGPGTGFGVLTSLPRGTEVEVIGNDGTGWVKLRTLEDRTVGWMAERLLTAPTG